MNTTNTSTTRRVTLLTITMRITALLAMTLTMGLGLLAPRQVSARRDAQATDAIVSHGTTLEEAAFEDPPRPSADGTRGRGQTQQPLPTTRTHLDCRKYSGGDLDSSSPWEKTVALTVRAKLYFRWSTTEPGVTSAEWQVTDSPGGFSTQQVGTPDTVIAHGQLQPIPAAGQARTFDINFIQLLPSSPPNTPKLYYIRVVLQKGGQRLSPSSSVKITYKKPGAQPTPDFDQVTEANIAAFATNIKSRLEGKTTGYSYAIFEGDKPKQLGAGGFAVLPSVPQSADRRMTTASMTKTITATAVMKAMEQMKAQGKNISIDSLILPYLPRVWKPGPHVREMTFRDLLNHTSGLRSVNDEDTFTSLGATIAIGSTDANWRVPKYQNPNFSLFRVIIAYMLLPRSELEVSGSDVLDNIVVDAKTADFYISFVKNHVLGPVGLSSVSLAPGPQEHVRYYSFFHPETYAVDHPYDWYRHRIGAGHWFMSAREFAQFIAGLRAGKIVSANTFKLMKDKQLGMYAGPSKLGTCWNHNGGFGDGSTGGLSCDWTIFPNGVSAVVFSNSAGGPAESADAVLSKAFNASQW